MLTSFHAHESVSIVVYRELSEARNLFSIRYFKYTTKAHLIYGIDLTCDVQPFSFLQHGFFAVRAALTTEATVHRRPTAAAERTGSFSVK